MNLNVLSKLTYWCYVGCHRDFVAGTNYIGHSCERFQTSPEIALSIWFISARRSSTGVDTAACQIWVKSFKLDPTFYCFSATTYIESLDVLGFIWPRLLISWPTLKIHSDVTNEAYVLPRTGLTWRQASFLRKILRQSFWRVLVTKTQSGYSLVTLPGRNWNSAPADGEVNHAVSLVSLKANASAPALYTSNFTRRCYVTSAV